MKLSERAMLSSLHIGSWTGKAIDREITEEVGESHNADPKDSGTYNKQLISRKALRDVLSKVSVVRQTHRMLSLPWDDDARILAAGNFTHYTAQMRIGRLSVEGAAKKLAENFPEWVKEAATRLGSMYNAGDYPTADEVRKRFIVDVELKPVPEAGDFRTKLSEATVKAVTKDIERRSNERVKRAMNDVFERVIDVTSKMGEKLRNYEGKTGQEGTFRDSLVTNVIELANLMPALNIVGDQRLDDLSKQLLAECGANSPELLRSDSKLRKQTAMAAEKLAKKAKMFLA